MKRTLLLILILPAVITAFAQKPELTTNNKVKWYTIQEAEKLMKESPRPLFIDTYTDWCGWCKRMDQDTFANSVIAEILNTKFYPVKFDAEDKESVTFLGQNFINDGKAGRAHQLAVALLNGQLSYPTVVFLTMEDDKPGVSPVPGYRPAKEMEPLLSFFADKAYKKTNWEEYQKSFVGKVK